MAQSRRVEKVSSLIRKELSILLRNGIRDHRINTGIITITDVELSGDLQHCKVFLSIFGENINKEEVLFALDTASGFLRGELGRRLEMRRSPELIFLLDKGMETGSSVLSLLGRLDQERKEKEQIPPHLGD